MRNEANPPLNFFSNSFETSAPVNGGGGEYRPAADYRTAPDADVSVARGPGEEQGGDWKTRMRARMNDRRFMSKVGCISCFFIFFLILIIVAFTYDKSNSYKVEVSAFCMEPPQGGGVVGPAGNFPDKSTRSEHCLRQLSDYFEGGNTNNYYSDINRVTSNVRSYFQSQSSNTQPARSQVIVFDIDETALSNKDAFQATLPTSRHHQYWDGYYYWDARRRLMSGEGAGQAGRQGGDSGFSTSSSGGFGFGAQYASSGLADSGLPGAGGGGGDFFTRSARSLKELSSDPLPPLSEVLKLYKDLYSMGYSVAFVTGRGEANREATVRNLASAGYGRACGGQPITTSPPPSSTPPEPPVDGGLTPPRASTPGTPPPSGRRLSQNGGLPCYTALYMRPYSDNRPASVVKPELREKLMQQYNVRLVGSLGDQWSDLNGDHSAPACFKLPNPMYFAL